MTTLYIILGVVAVALVVLIILFIVQKKKKARAAAAGTEDAGPGGDEISVLVHEAEGRLAAAKIGPAARVGNLPVYLLLGDSGTTKTSVVIHSGLEPELLSGQVDQAGTVAPTRSANFWYSKRSIFAEAGGPLLADAGKFARLVKRLQPRSSVVGKGEQAPRAAVVCFDCENFTRQNAAEAASAAARSLRARLGEISQAMGINLPVYVLFTKTDRLPFFTDYVRNLSNEESTQVVGATLPMLNRRGEGVYAEQETARLTGTFERLFRSLADARPELLARETDPPKLPPSYEFPREFRKIRPALVQFLVDLCRPSQLTVGPFLRGFYFTGVRPVVINEAAPVAAAVPQSTGAGQGQAAGATGIFSFRAGAAAAGQAAPPPVIATRKVPQWLFLSHLFNDILLGDRAAMGASGSSIKVSGARRILFIAIAALCFLLTIGFTISFFNNRALENRVRVAAQALGTDAAGPDLASTASLRKLDTLRQALETLSRYHREGAPFFYRWFLFVGDDLYPETRRVYFARFRQLLLAPTQANIVPFLTSLPGQNPEYWPTYNALKAYLVTTSNHEKSDPDFLTPALSEWWTRTRPVEPDRLQLAQKQFGFYGAELKEENPFPSTRDEYAVERGRRYLAQFAGADRVYAFMLGEANRASKAINFNRQFPGSAQTVVETYEVQGAFSKDGWAFMKEAIAHPDKYLGGERWVLGDQGAGTIDRVKLADDLRSRYYADFIRAWRAYIKGGSVVKYAGLKDASDKLTQLSGNQSALLELFALASQNTAVDEPKVAAIFQPVQAVVPPGSIDRFVAPPNQNYVNALLQLQMSVEGIADQQPPSDQAAAQTLDKAKDARGTTRQIANTFNIDSEGHVEGSVAKLLEDPITNVEGLLRRLGPEELNGKGRAMCAQIHPALAKYPFNPKATIQATIADVDAVFKPKEGAIWQFVDANLQKVLTRQGTQYVVNPAGGVQVNPAFIAFLNRASDFTEKAYGGTPTAHFSYFVKPQISADMDSIKLTIDGQAMIFKSSTTKQYTWPGPAQGVQMAVTYKGGTTFTYPNYDGLWSVLLWVADADVHNGATIEMIAKGGRQNRPLQNPATHQDVVARFEIGANPPIFNPGYFSSIGCVGDVAKP